MWKIADFGLTSAGTSKRAQTTIYSRGTCSYRAPELIADEKSTYTNKVDIWALGCILYELAFGKKAFVDDLAVYQYSLQWSASGEKMAVPSTSDTIPHEDKRLFVSNVIHDTVTMDETKRPKAKDLYHKFIGWGQNRLRPTRDELSSSSPPPAPRSAPRLPTLEGIEGKMLLHTLTNHLAKAETARKPDPAAPQKPFWGEYVDIYDAGYFGYTSP